MIKLNENSYFGEILLRQSATEDIKKAKLARNVYVGGVQFIKTFTPSNICDYLYTVQGKPTYAVYGGGKGEIAIGSDLDIAYMKSGVSCRSISGRIQGMDINYNTNTTTAKYGMVCNFTAAVYAGITLTKRSFGYYQTEFILSIWCGNNSQNWTVSGGSGSADFSIKYNGTAYVATYVQRNTVGTNTYSVTGEDCREQSGRLELAASNAVVSGPYSGFVNLTGEITTGMARY